MTVKPITPQEVDQKRQDSFPDEVITVFNEMIVEKWRNGYARVDQDEVATKIAARMNVPRSQVFDRGWLDVEQIFRGAGWKVMYDKPGYCEDYDAYFEFRR